MNFSKELQFGKFFLKKGNQYACFQTSNFEAFLFRSLLTNNSQFFRNLLDGYLRYDIIRLLLPNWITKASLEHFVQFLRAKSDCRTTDFFDVVVKALDEAEA